MSENKNRSRIVSWKKSCKRTLEVSFIAGLLVLSTLFYSFRNYTSDNAAMSEIETRLMLAQVEPPKPEEPEIVEFFKVEQKPEVKKKVAPRYPKSARKSGISGKVVVKVLVDIKGDVQKAEIKKSIPMLDQAALDAALQFKFKPGKQRGKLVRVWMNVPFDFKLK